MVLRCGSVLRETPALAALPNVLVDPLGERFGILLRERRARQRSPQIVQNEDFHLRAGENRVRGKTTRALFLPRVTG